MTRPIIKPLTRAQGHLAAGRLAEATGAFRAVLAIQPGQLDAQLGLATAVAGWGARDEAIDGLLEAATAHMEAERYPAALSLYAKALTLDPDRTEIHLDVAFVESAMGRHEAAISRIESLADSYMSTGRTDEAAELLRFVATWDDEDDANEQAAAPAVSTETVVCSTVLIRPDGSLMFPEQDSGPAPERTVPRAVSAPIVLDEVEPDPDMITNVAPLPPPPPHESDEGAPTVVRMAPTPPPGRPTPAPARAETPSPVATPRSSSTRIGDKLRLDRAPRPGAARPSPSDHAEPTPGPRRPRAPQRLSGPPRAGVGSAVKPPPVVSSTRPSSPAPSRATPARAPSAPSRRPSTPERPTTRARPARPSGSPLAERLRQRAGLGSSPRATTVRSTEPITTRRVRSRAEVDEEITQRLRRPDLRRPAR